MSKSGEGSVNHFEITLTMSEPQTSFGTTSSTYNDMINRFAPYGAI